MSSDPRSLLLILRSLLFNPDCLLLLLRSLFFSLSHQLFQLLQVLLLTWPHLLLSQCHPTIHHFLITQAHPLPVMVLGPLYSPMAVSTILFFIGVPECPKGTSYQDRISSDHSSVLRVLESVGSLLSMSSLRDCLRLGKYKDDASIPCPLLIKFNGIRDVQFVLRNRTKLVMDSGSKIFVRKDLSKEERRTESLLLTERRTLLGEGIQSSCI